MHQKALTPPLPRYTLQPSRQAPLAKKRNVSTSCAKKKRLSAVGRDIWGRAKPGACCVLLLLLVVFMCPPPHILLMPSYIQTHLNCVQIRATSPKLWLHISQASSDRQPLYAMRNVWEGAQRGNGVGAPSGKRPTCCRPGHMLHAQGICWRPAWVAKPQSAGPAWHASGTMKVQRACWRRIDLLCFQCRSPHRVHAHGLARRRHGFVAQIWRLGRLRQLPRPYPDASHQQVVQSTHGQSPDSPCSTAYPSVWLSQRPWHC